MVRDGDRATVTRPEAVRIVEGDDAVVTAADRDGYRAGPFRDATTAPGSSPSSSESTRRVGSQVGVEIDPAGVVKAPVWPPDSRAGALDSTPAQNV